MRINIDEKDGVYVGTLEGRLDTNAAQQFMKDIQPLIEHADKQIILDCSGLEYISSSGLRAFLTLRKESADKGGHVVIAHINEDIRKVFTMTGFFNLFDIK